VRLGLAPTRSGYWQKHVELAARLGKKSSRFGALLLGANLGNLVRGERHVLDGVAQLYLHRVDATEDVFPRRVQARVGCEVRAALVGELKAALAGIVQTSDQALVLEELQGRVDGAGTRLPYAAAAISELADDLVAVHRLLGEQGENCGPDVAATGAPATMGVRVPAMRAEKAEVRASLPAAARGFKVLTHVYVSLFSYLRSAGRVTAFVE
jgi:hypothetical protein